MGRQLLSPPPGKPVNAFSIDVEDYFQVAALAPAIPRDSWPTREYRVEANTERILELLAEKGVRGTFFVLGWVAEKSPGLVKRIAAAGHEIACHGFSHQLIYSQSQSEFREETARAKRFLERHHRRSPCSATARRASRSRASRCGRWMCSSIWASSTTRPSFPSVTIATAFLAPRRPSAAITAPSQRTLVEFPMSAASFWACRCRCPAAGISAFCLTG